MLLSRLLETLIRHLQSGSASERAEAKCVAKRFVRSVIRVFVVFNVEMSPAQGKKRSLQSATQPLQRCKRAFQVRTTATIFFPGKAPAWHDAS